MKKIFLVLILLNIFISNDVFSKDKKSNRNPEVLGGYKKCTTYCSMFKLGKWETDSKYIYNISKYDEKGFEFESIVFETNGNISNKLTYKFDDIGNNTEYLNTKVDGSIICQIITKYNFKGILKEMTMVQYNDYVETGSTFKYDEKGNEIKQLLLFSGDTITIEFMNKYDIKGNLIERIEGKSKISLDTMFYAYIYDTNNNLIMRDKCFTGKVLLEKETYKYDIDGNMTEYFWSNNVSYKKDTYQYDKKGNKIEHRFQCSFNPEITNETYKYDEDGNISEEIKYKNLDEPETKYEYIYSK
jgi:hypothetical protein